MELCEQDLSALEVKGVRTWEFSFGKCLHQPFFYTGLSLHQNLRAESDWLGLGHMSILLTQWRSPCTDHSSLCASIGPEVMPLSATDRVFVEG